VHLKPEDSNVTSRHSRGTARRSQRGTTLIETLVALVVLSIGLLGIAALQMTSLRNNRGAHLRSQAATLAYDIVDRMRANRSNAIDPGVLPYVVALGSAPTGATVAALDLQSWKATLALTLPGGDGSIVQPTPTTVVVTVTWTDTLDAENSNRGSGVQTFVTRTQI
jgi:type IV pilus assembly protein PilV